MKKIYKELKVKLYFYLIMILSLNQTYHHYSHIDCFAYKLLFDFLLKIYLILYNSTFFAQPPYLLIHI
jgi:hypothetical protein